MYQGKTHVQLAFLEAKQDFRVPHPVFGAGAQQRCDIVEIDGLCFVAGPGAVGL